MSTPDPATNDRLDSWKAISAYLGRDERTLRRWERELGLPIRRVAGGSSASVFAYKSDIDAWLARRHHTGPAQEDAASRPSINRRAGLMGALATLAAIVAAGWWWNTREISPHDLEIDVSATGVTAYDRRGVEQWRHDFPNTHTTAIPARDAAWAIVDQPSPQVLALTSVRTSRIDGQIEGGALMAFSPTGRLNRTFTLDDQVTFGGQRFEAPWGLVALAVETTSPHRIAIAGHHYVWNPGVITLLDAQWRRRGTFFHPGWIEMVRWISPTALIIGGYSNARNGGMLALLHPEEVDGQSPEPPASPHYCNTCGPHRPVREVIMPRSEVNLAAGAPFNRAVVQVMADRIIARTVEVSSEQGPADAIYEFTPSLDLIRATFSERYFDQHRALELQGKIGHPLSACPERRGPPAIETWDRLNGWQHARIHGASTGQDVVERKVSQLLMSPLLNP